MVTHIISLLTINLILSCLCYRYSYRLSHSWHIFGKFINGNAIKYAKTRQVNHAKPRNILWGGVRRRLSKCPMGKSSRHCGVAWDSHEHGHYT